MNHTPTAWWDFGYFGIFGCVFLEQIGVPIPAFPALLAAGALVASGELNFFTCLATALVAALSADLIWYSIGRAKGGSVLNLMCRLSWKPDTCVGKTKTVFAEHGTKTLLFSKFVPGLSTLAPPLAGMTQVPFGRFIAFDSVGTLIWAMAPLLAGLYLQHSFASWETSMQTMRNFLPWICGFLILFVLVWRYLDRRFYLQALWKGSRNSMGVEELKRRIDRRAELVLLDIRHSLDQRQRAIPTHIWMPNDTLEHRLTELPKDRPIVVYCDCPHDEGSIAAVEVLRKHGFNQAVPLHGGLSAWIAKGFETEDVSASSDDLVFSLA